MIPPGRYRSMTCSALSRPYAARLAATCAGSVVSTRSPDTARTNNWPTLSSSVIWPRVRVTQSWAGGAEGGGDQAVRPGATARTRRTRRRTADSCRRLQTAEQRNRGGGGGRRGGGLQGQDVLDQPATVTQPAHPAGGVPDEVR